MRKLHVFSVTYIHARILFINVWSGGIAPHILILGHSLSARYGEEKNSSYGDSNLNQV